MHIPEQENILSLNGNINYTNENSAKDSESNEINISIISTTSKKLESSTVNKSDKLQNNNCNWDNKQSGRTSIEKAIYEEIIKEDFHKNDTE